MSRRERVLAFILGVIICSLLSCGLSVIAQKNDVILSGTQTFSTHLTANSVPLHNQTSTRASATNAHELWWPWRRELHSVDKNLTGGSQLDTISKSNTALDHTWWQMWGKQVNASDGEEVDGRIGGVLQKASAQITRAMHSISSSWERWGAVARPREDKSTSMFSNQAGNTENQTKSGTMVKKSNVDSVRASHEVFQDESGIRGGANVTMVLAGLMGVVACALVGMGTVKVIRARDGDEEGEIRRTVFEDQRNKGAGEESLENLVRDTVDEIMPEEAV